MQILWCYHENETSLAVFSHGTIYLAWRSHVWVFRLNPTVRPFKWNRGTQRQFSENICSEDDLRSRIFGTFFVSCLPASPRIFQHLKNGIIAHFYRIFTLKRSPKIFGSLFLAEIFEKVSSDPYNVRITILSARKSEQMKNFGGIKICLHLTV